jgi:hypothetical protein
LEIASFLTHLLAAFYNTWVSLQNSGAMHARSFTPARSWTCKPNSEQAREHDFSNLLEEFAYAVRRQDQMMMEYCESELKRMFRERKATARPYSNALAHWIRRLRGIV